MRALKPIVKEHINKILDMNFPEFEQSGIEIETQWDLQSMDTKHLSCQLGIDEDEEKCKALRNALDMNTFLGFREGIKLVLKNL